MRVWVYLAMRDDGSIISAHRTYSGACDAVKDEIREVGERSDFTPEQIEECIQQFDAAGWVDGIGGIEDGGELYE